MEAQHRVGLLYKDGRGVPRDPFTAHRWFGSAALAGHALAQCAVGTQYFMGEGVALDYSAAMLHFRMAAEQGNAFGQYSLGVCYERGLGVPRGVDEALRLYRLSSRNGCVEATERLVRLEERSRREQTMVREEQERAIRQSEQRLSQINEQQRILDQVSQSLRSTHLSDTRPEAAASQGSNATLFSTHSSPPESYRSMSTFAERAEAPSVSMIARGTDLETERPDATSVSITARGTDFEGEDARPEPKEERQRHVPRPKHWIEERDVEIDKSSPLDKGGFGQVYRGKHLKRHDVAIKVYLENRTEQQIKTAFEAEIAIWGDIPSSDYGERCFRPLWTLIGGI